jgi:hypothetical protein
MKKGLPEITACLFVLVFAGRALAVSGGAEWSRQAFANEMALAKEVRFTGRVVSHDTLQHSLAVDTLKGELTFRDDYTRFMQEYNEAEGIRIGAPVAGTYKRVDHVNYLTWIHYTE